MFFDGLIYLPCSKSKALELEDKLFRKEVIHEGNWEKGDIKFSVDKDLINHWIGTFNEMQYDGIEVPKPLNHTENPELRRGTVIRLESGLNENGKLALYEVFKFRDEQAAKDLKDADVSIYVPLEFKAGNGKTYKYPIRHIAFTDYPVIPKLGKMQPIAASYVEAERKPVSKKEKKMPFPPNKGKMDDENKEEVEKDDENAEETVESLHAELREIATKLGLDDSIPDNKLCAAINHVVDAIMDSDDEENDDDDDDEKPGDKTKSGGAHVAREVKHEEREFHPPIAAGFINMARKSRLQELDTRVEKGILTPAAKNKLVKEYCNDNALQLAFSHEGEVFDNFDYVLSVIDDNANALGSMQEKSQNQELSLAYNSLKPENNALLRDAEARAKKAGQA